MEQHFNDLIFINSVNSVEKMRAEHRPVQFMNLATEYTRASVLSLSGFGGQGWFPCLHSLCDSLQWENYVPVCYMPRIWKRMTFSSVQNCNKL